MLHYVGYIRVSTVCNTFSTRTNGESAYRHDVQRSVHVSAHTWYNVCMCCPLPHCVCRLTRMPRPPRTGCCMRPWSASWRHRRQAVLKSGPQSRRLSHMCTHAHAHMHSDTHIHTYIYTHNSTRTCINKHALHTLAHTTHMHVYTHTYTQSPSLHLHTVDKEHPRDKG